MIPTQKVGSATPASAKVVKKLSSLVCALAPAMIPAGIAITMPIMSEAIVSVSVAGSFCLINEPIDCLFTHDVPKSPRATSPTQIPY
jgi:hypothetical protein